MSHPNFVHGAQNWFERFLNYPVRILLACALFILLSLSGYLSHLYTLYIKEKDLQTRIQRYQNDNVQLLEDIQYTMTDEFLNRQARESLDLAHPKDLIFVFSP